MTLRRQENYLESARMSPGSPARVIAVARAMGTWMDTPAVDTLCYGVISESIGPAAAVAPFGASQHF